MLRTPAHRCALPLFRPLDDDVRKLRPLSDHRLLAPPRVSATKAGAAGKRLRLRSRTQPLIGGVAVLAVAGALSAGPSTGGRETRAPRPAAAGDELSSGATAASIPAASVVPPSRFDALLTVGYATPLPGASAGGPDVTTAAFVAPEARMPALRGASVDVSMPLRASMHGPMLQLSAQRSSAQRSSALPASAQHAPTLAGPRVPQGAAVVTHQDSVAVKAMTSELRRLRACESGGNYREASGNGYYGAYQFDLSTWRSLGLVGFPSNASRQLQDVAVVRLQARKGWGPWPVCSYVAGLR